MVSPGLTLLSLCQETSPGVPFWAGDRSCPHPLTFDPDNVSAGESHGAHGQGESRACAGYGGCQTIVVCAPPATAWSARALLGMGHTCPAAGGGGEAPPSPPQGNVGRLWPCGLMAHPGCPGALPHRTPTWSTSWLLHTSLPKHTRCHHAVTGRPPRPSSAVWSCHPSCPRRGSRFPLQRSGRRCRRLQVRVPESSLVAVGLRCCLFLPQHPGGPRPRWRAPCHAPPVPWCRGTTPGFFLPPDCGRLAELTQDLVQRKQELIGGEDVQMPLMEPIHFEKVPGPGRQPCSVWRGWWLLADVSTGG